MKILSAAVFISGSLCILCSNFLVDFASATQAVPKPDQKNLKGGVKNAPLQQRKGSVPINPPKPVNDKLKDGSNKTETKNAKNTLSKPPMQVTDKSKDEAKKTPLQSTPKLTPKTKEVPKESNWDMWLSNNKKDYKVFKRYFRTCLYDWYRASNVEYNTFLDSLGDKWSCFPENTNDSELMESLKSFNGTTDMECLQWMKKNLKYSILDDVELWLECKQEAYEKMTPTYWDAWEKEKLTEIEKDEWNRRSSSGKTKDWENLKKELMKHYDKKVRTLWRGYKRDVYFRFGEWSDEIFEKWIQDKMMDKWKKGGKK
ncbi:hypothetical protein PVBG_00598 [Plasmodium vivax Brazil I]|uniref:Tryptophan/threonine-rich plasmodium antigen C-terminal domain-containing protein n=1 Tax=Plasmodium vivax (strain Brazil I) TaxID=1033975 RepID=A0A0J9SLD6_PLAV1|nr:hypothetical protein PVBG_00598 [Plasmodium vivax Brazil I]